MRTPIKSLLGSCPIVVIVTIDNLLCVGGKRLSMIHGNIKLTPCTHYTQIDADSISGNLSMITVCSLANCTCRCELQTGRYHV